MREPKMVTRKKKIQKVIYVPKKIVVTDGSWELKANRACHTITGSSAIMGKWSKDPSVAKMWLEVIDKNGKRTIKGCINMDAVRRLWGNLEDVIIDEDERLIDRWGDRVHGFDKGTHREEIWHWFEETFCISVADDLMYADD